MSQDERVDHWYTMNVREMCPDSTSISHLAEKTGDLWAPERPVVLGTCPE